MADIPYSYYPSHRNKCPHCGVIVRFESTSHGTIPHGNSNFNVHNHGVSHNGEWDGAGVVFSACPDCNSLIVESYVPKTGARLLYPRVPSRGSVHVSVPPNIRNDYEEAVLVMGDSPNASAALSRRCLQALLVEQGAKKRDLKDQIDELACSFPSYVKEFVDHVRQLGNIAAHTKQDVNTAEILPVVEGEAVYMIEVLEQLFDHYYAKPAAAENRKQEIEAKLARATKHQPQPDTAS